MKQRILIFLAVVLVALSAMLLWRANDARNPRVDGSPETSQAASPGAAEPLSPSEENTEDASESLSATSGERSGVAVSPTADEIIATRTLRITMQWPAGVPSDERAELTTVDFPLSKFTSEDAALAASIEYQATNFEGILFGGQRVDSKTKHGVRRPCESDGKGGWTAHVSNDASVVFVELAARYCYLEKPLRVDASAQSVEVAPKLGGLLVGALDLPAVLPPDFDAQALEKIDVQLNGFGMGTGGSHGMAGKLKADATFELGGLHAGLNYFLAIDPQVLAPISDMEITVNAGERIERRYAVMVGARVRGRVIGPDGAPVAEANVRVRPSRPSMRMAENRSANTDDAGRFDLRGIVPGKITLSARREGFVTYNTPEAEVLELSDAQVVDPIELRLSAGDSISGIVRWPDGSPTASAEIEVVETRAETLGRGRGMSNNTVRARSESDGTFRVSGLSASKVTVTATAQREIEALPAKFRAQRADVDVATPIEIVLEAPIAIRGRVVDAGGVAQPNFRIVATASGETRAWNAQPREFKGTDGTFTLFLAPGEYQVHAGAEGFTDSPSQTLRLPPEVRDLTFELTRAAEIAGVVRSPLGEPIEGAVVAQRRSGRGMVYFSGGDEEAKSDAEGRFRLKGINPGSVSISARSDGYARSAELELIVEPGVAIEDAELRLRVGGRVEGEIFDSNGRPDPDRQIVVGSFGMDSEGMGGSAKSDAAGRFVVEHVAPGNYNVMAVPRMNNMREGERNEAEMIAQLKMTTVEVIDGQTSHVVLGAPPKSPVLVSGRVTQGGTPLSRGTVMIFADGASMLSSMKAAQIGADGRYSMQVDAPGDYSFIVGERMGDDQATEFQESIPEVPEYTLDLAVPAGGIRGRVTASDGSPVIGISVRRESEGHNSIFAFDMGDGVSTDQAGRFEMRNLRPGTYTLRVGAPAFGGFGGGGSKYGAAVRSGLVVQENQTLDGIEIQLDVACVITGHVRGSDGSPVADATVFVRDASGRVVNPMSSCMTDSSGRFEFNQASAGTYTVSARKDNLASRESAAVRVLVGEAAKVELALETGTILTVSVEDGDGKSVRANIRVVDEAGRDHSRLMGAESFQRLMTEGFSSKEQKVGPLPPGKYRVTATAADGKTESKPMTLSGQAERSMKLRFD